MPPPPQHGLCHLGCSFDSRSLKSHSLPSSIIVYINLHYSVTYWIPFKRQTGATYGCMATGLLLCLYTGPVCDDSAFEAVVVVLYRWTFLPFLIVLCVYMLRNAAVWLLYLICKPYYYVIIITLDDPAARLPNFHHPQRRRWSEAQPGCLHVLRLKAINLNVCCRPLPISVVT